MPRLGNDKHELYARHRAKGMSPSKAAPAANFSPNSSTTHLEENPEIRARIDELRAEHEAVKEQQNIAAREAAKVVGQLAGYGRSWVIQQLAEVAGLAKNDQAYKEAITALELIGKDFGMFKGASEEDRGDVPKTTDLDALASLVNSAHEALPTVEDIHAMPPLNDEEAAELIAGQKRAEAEKPKAANNTITVADAAEPFDYDALRRSLEDGDFDDEEETPDAGDDE
ncbi:terminase small subunit [Caulobacter phage CcrColossus]|uniref:Putative terminase small subunit n=1 Tax=Caulobacter phage CcrColossus TaxID=1211640 RepID=K4K6U2_9CAUD|nr:terminase small subunit [Caulobacter phage CcrColossus]AFU88317.1 putative terminase small subunit [Caulobacter phage CcrColossus]